jgi:DNA-binding PadR family transcriptional regulator
MADARLLVLVSLSDGAKHGYAIQTDVNDFAAVRLGPGTLYGALSSLERDGFVAALPSEERRRPYQLTARGREQLAQQLEELDRIRQRVTSALT